MRSFEKFTLYEPVKMTYSAGTAETERSSMYERIHIPIGTGDHLIEILMNRTEDQPRVTIEFEPQTVRDRCLTVKLSHGRKHLKKLVHVENFEIFGTVLREMDREIMDMEERKPDLQALIDAYEQELSYLKERLHDEEER